VVNAVDTVFGIRETCRIRHLNEQQHEVAGAQVKWERGEGLRLTSLRLVGVRSPSLTRK
jgi:hypothetical protein